jgi:hypothetical protein
MKPTNIQMQKAGAQTDILTMAYLPLLIWCVMQNHHVNNEKT